MRKSDKSDYSFTSTTVGRMPFWAISGREKSCELASHIMYDRVEKYERAGWYFVDEKPAEPEADSLFVKPVFYCSAKGQFWLGTCYVDVTFKDKVLLSEVEAICAKHGFEVHECYLEESGFNTYNCFFPDTETALDAALGLLDEKLVAAVQPHFYLPLGVH